jgi:ribulose 1,5-bisphosphate synthetase/thiazole synthase
MAALRVKYLNRLPDGAPTVVQEARDLPVVYEADVAVAGGGVAGVAAALAKAAEGFSVALVEERNHFGFELTAPYKVTTPPYRPAHDYPISESVCRDLAEDGSYKDGYIDPDALKRTLHARVAAEPLIKPYLYSLGTGLLVEEGIVRGMVMVNRSGRQVVLAPVVIDATDDGRLAAAAGARFVRSWSGEKTIRRFVRLWKDVDFPAGPLSVPTELGVIDDAVVIHHASTTFFEYAFEAQVGERPVQDLSRIQAASLDKALDLIHHLEEMIGPMSGPEAVPRATTTKAMDRFSIAPEIFVDETPAVACRNTLTRDDVQALQFADPDTTCIEELDGLMLAGRILSPEMGLTGLQALLCSGEATGRAAISRARNVKGSDLTKPTKSAPELSGGTHIRELLNGPDMTAPYPRIRELEIDIPVGDTVDLVVAGGGTSGAMAAIAAAEEGARVAVLDTLAGLGGTGTHMVTTYYWGASYRSVLSQEIDDAIPTYWRAVGKQNFSGQEKMRALQTRALKAGVSLYYQTVAAGVVMEGEAITGVIVENAEGRQVIQTKMVIDGTGHGDVAAMAGAAFTRGRETDGFMMEMNAPGKGLRDPTNVEDITTFLMKKPVTHIAFPLRESRIIQGDHVLTFKDLLTRRHFPDAVVGWRSNFDTHFPHSANESDVAQDWMAILGLFRKPLSGTVPYGCLLPRGVDNLYVVGKAFSSDHDAKIAVRMQSDLQHLGEAAGTAAALAVQGRTTARQLPIEDLQQRLLERGILQPQHLQTDTPPHDLEGAVKKLGTPDALEGMTTLYQAGAQSVPFIHPHVESDNPDVRVEASILLGVLGEQAAIPVLMDILKTKDSRTFVYSLEGASEKDSVPAYYSATILLGRFREKAAVPYLTDILKDRENCPLDIASFAITALGRMGDSSAVEAIQPFLGTGGVSADVMDENTAFEQKWGVRTNAAKALAELGDLSGVPFLIELLADDQAQVRDYAQRLLEETSGQTFGKDPDKWQRWWESHAERVP